MVHKIVASKHRTFVECFILTFLILLIGFFIGFLVESNRLQEIEDSAKIFEIESFDLKLQNYYYQIMDETTCDNAIEQNFIFADKIYDKGLILERYEEANEILDSILLE